MARAGAWVAILVQPVWLLCWVLVGALEPGYSPAHQWVSELGSIDNVGGWLVDAGIALWGISTIAAAVALRAVGPPRAWLPALLIGVAGVLISLAGPLHMDCQTTLHHGCGHSFSHHAHIALSSACQPLLALSAPALVWALWPSTLSLLLVPGSALGIGYYVWGWLVPTGDHTLQGVGERVGIAMCQGWALLIGVGVLVTLETAARQPKRARYAATQSVAISR